MGDLVGLVECLDSSGDGGERCNFYAGKELGFELIGKDEVCVLKDAFVGWYFIFWDVELSFIAHYWVQYCHIPLISRMVEDGFGVYPRRMNPALCLREI